MRSLLAISALLGLWAIPASAQTCCQNCNGNPCSNMCGDICLDGQKCQNGQQYQCQNGTPYCPTSPIIIDSFGEGFHLTNIIDGVRFRVVPNKLPSRISWTDANWRNGWLALDRNGNGVIDDISELFGDMTVQPPSKDRNGYKALAVFDDPANGGNGNGMIDPGDSVFDRLRLWIDANHNGVSEPQELHTLREVGIFSIDLKYTLSRYVDENGNQFRYRAKIRDEAGVEHDFCYDVFIEAEVGSSR